jgi:predicted small secreted protein
MKTVLFTVITIFSALIINAQETFFPTKEGMVLTYKNFDKKEKLSGVMKYTIEKVNISGSDIDFTYLCEVLDNKEKLVFKEEITVHQKGELMYFDMGNFLNKAAFQQDGTIPAEVEVNGNNMEIPLNPVPGQTLPDANIEMALKMGFVNMKMSADITNRKVEGIEDISVSGGTFKCYKFSGDVNTVAMGIKVQAKTVEWFAKGIGIVKTESYDKKGNLTGRTELVEVK